MGSAAEDAISFSASASVINVCDGCRAGSAVDGPASWGAIATGLTCSVLGAAAVAESADESAAAECDCCARVRCHSAAAETFCRLFTSLSTPAMSRQFIASIFAAFQLLTVLMGTGTVRVKRLTDVLACRDVLTHVLSFCSFATSLALLQTCWTIRDANLTSDRKLSLAYVHDRALPHVNIDAVRTVVLHNAREVIAAIRRGDVRSVNQLVSSDSQIIPGLRTLLWHLCDEDDDDDSGEDAELVSSCAHRIRMVFFPEGNALCTKEGFCSLYLLAPPTRLLWAMSIDGVECTSRMYSHEFSEGESQWGSATMWPTAKIFSSRCIRCDILESPYKMQLDELDGAAARWHVWNLRNKCAWARTSCSTRYTACEMHHDALLSPRFFGGAVRLALFLHGRDCETQRCWTRSAHCSATSRRDSL